VQKTDTHLFHWIDVPAAIGLLTRIPVKVDVTQAQARGPAGCWAYPVAGLAVALCQIAIAGTGLWIGLPVEAVAALTLACAIIITGAMHEDGLADTADGLWGGWTVERRLEIMKDSRIGAYGVIALILGLLLRWACLVAIFENGQWIAALIAIAMLSRAAMVALMTGLPNARDGGLSRSVGRPSPATAWVAIGVATLGAVIATGLTAGTLLIVGAILTSLCAGIAKRKIGGQTGDILGASQQVVEIGLLITLTTI